MLSAIDATKIESSNSKLKWLVIALLLGVCFAVAGWWWHVDRAERDSAIDRFWAPFFANNSSLVIYSNPLFVGNATDGLRYAPPSDDSTANLTGNYSYTGVGEVVSGYDLSRLFASYHATFTLKRSLLVTWDEAMLKNLIFIGSTQQTFSRNPTYRLSAGGRLESIEKAPQSSLNESEGRIGSGNFI